MFLSIFKQRKSASWALAGLMTLSLCSCESGFVFEDLRPCVPDYRVKLSYTHNLKNEERVNQVEAAEIYAFDVDGNLAKTFRANRQELIDNNWSVPVDLERFQNYDLVIWAGLVENSPFSLDGTRAVTSKSDLTCRLSTSTDETGREISSASLPPLFHATSNVTFDAEDGLQEHLVGCVKNTNTVDVIIRKKDGTPVHSQYYDLDLYDNNAVMEHNNNVPGSAVTYHFADFQTTELGTPDGSGGMTPTITNVGIAKFHCARLMKGSQARLEIKIASSGLLVFNEKIIDLLLAAKQHIAPGMNDQEYLDRQDEYELELVLPVDEDWTKIEIYINKYRIIKNDIEWK